MKTRIILMIVVSFLAASCTTQEDRLRDFVEQDVIGKAEDHLICQAIVNYVKGNANEAITERANYWYNNFDHDWSWFERETAGSFLGLAKYSGSLKKDFDERFGLWATVYNYLINIEEAYYIDYKIRGLDFDTSFSFRTLLTNHDTPYSIEKIGDLFFMPTKYSFHKITIDEEWLIYKSLIGLGVENYQHDVVDDIRIKKEEENYWSVDLVYHSGKCINFTIVYHNGRFMTKDTTWPSDIFLNELDSTMVADGIWG